MGFGMERAQARRSATVVIIVAALLAVVVLWRVFGGVAS
jgi:hypothetical protein